MILIQSHKEKELILNVNVKIYDIELEKLTKNNQKLT